MHQFSKQINVDSMGLSDPRYHASAIIILRRKFCLNYIELPCIDGSIRPESKKTKKNPPRSPKIPQKYLRKRYSRVWQTQSTLFHHYAVDLETGPSNPFKVVTYEEAIWNLSFLGPIILYEKTKINRFGSVRPDATVLGLIKKVEKKT